LACHPSKDPVFIDLYSSSKFFAILLLSVISLFGFYYANVHNKYSNKRSNRLLDIQFPSHCFGIEPPFFLALSVLLISYLFNLNTSFTTGVDFATHLKATLQWDEGLTKKWNYLVQADLKLIQDDSNAWLFRPPGAMLYYFPFIKLPFPLGESLRISQLILCITLCFCWLNIAKILNCNKYLQILLGLILSLWLSNLLSFIGNVQLLVATYSSICTLISFKFILKIKSPESFQFRNSLTLFILSLFLGGIIFLKASALVYNCAILVSIFAFLYLKRIKVLNLVLTSITSILLFCCPYLVLRSINEANGIDLHNLYMQDYNSQWLTQELWGNYFTETTQIPAVFLSLAASFSTFSPFNLAQTLLSNFLTYIGLLDDFILSIHLNPKVIYKATVGSLFSILLGFCLLKYLNPSRKTTYILGFTLFFPFAVFAYLANQHGYNYLITGTYNQQYIPLFCLLILIASFNLLKKDDRKALLLAVPIIFFSIGLFSFSNTSSLLGSFKNRFESRSLSSNHIGHPFFGENLKMLDDAILKHRKSAKTPIIYLANSSIEEMCIAYKGRYTGLSNISTLLKNHQYTLPSFSTEALIILDARLKDEELEIINTMISRNNHSYLLNLPETAKVIYMNG
jgi:hypothetical protein